MPPEGTHTMVNFNITTILLIIFVYVTMFDSITKPVKVCTLSKSFNTKLEREPSHAARSYTAAEAVACLQNPLPLAHTQEEDKQLADLAQRLLALPDKLQNKIIQFLPNRGRFERYHHMDFHHPNMRRSLNTLRPCLIGITNNGAVLFLPTTFHKKTRF